MTPELIDYIISHYTHLFSKKVKFAYKHHHVQLKHQEADPMIRNAILRHWGTNDKESLMLLDNGYDNFKRIVAERIMKEQSNEIIINKCPNCGELARTPFAKQCRHCGFDWHNK
jgi:hypothetical protein